MLKNYIKTAWRNMLKQRSFSIINIAGLSFSVAFCLLLFFYIRHEQSYDGFHTRKNRLFRMEMTDVWAAADAKPKEHFFSFLTQGNDINNQLTFPLIVGRDLKQDFPEVKNMIRFKDEGDHLVKAGNQVYKEQHLLYADNMLFTSLSFPLTRGNPKNAFPTPQSIVITEELAKKYFGDDEPIGKTIQLIGDSISLFTVAGIAAPAPANSSIRYDIIFPLTAYPGYERNIRERFNHSEHHLVIELADGVAAEAFEKKINLWIQDYFVPDYKKYFKNFDFKNFHWYLRPLADAHYNVSVPWGHYTNAKNIYQLACLVIIILLIASLNYVLIVISNAAARSQEVGIRKIMGANRRSVILQFWVETQLLVLIAVIFGLALARLFTPLFNNAIGTDLLFENIAWKEIILSAAALCLILGLIAGYYPALLLSNMKTATIVKGLRTFRINPQFSSVMIVAQYTGCAILMMAAFVINRQMQYISNKDLGFDKDQVLMVSNPTWDFEFTKKVKNRFAVFAQTQPAILQYSGMNGGLNGAYNTNGFVLNGQKKDYRELTVDYNYFEMLGLKILIGRSFSREFADTSHTIKPAVINETMLRMLGKDAKLGEYNEAIDRTIIGVVKDYNFESLSKKVEPEIHVLARDYVMYFMFKIKAGQTQETIAKIEREWKTMTNNYPFEYIFLDQTITQMYEPDMRWQKTIQASCFFAILIACMGLFGLSAINAANRTKEIGIRKILGADMKDIVGTLSAQFLLLVTISILIATPIAWWMMNSWLKDFAYRIQLSWWMFALAGMLALLIALITISIRAIKAAVSNPADSLRTE